MAIAFDAAANGSWSSGTSFTFNHTVSGTNRIIWAAVDTGNNNIISGVTYNGVAMTQAGTTQSSGGAGPFYTSLWYLVAPATGTNAVVVSLSGTPSDSAYCTTMSYTGAAQTGVPDATSGSGNASATTLTGTVTTTVNNAWVVYSYANNNGSSGSITGGVQRGAAPYSRQGGDSNGAIVLASSKSITITNGSAASVAISLASFAPYAASLVNSNFLIFM